jgi:hypothetical protein
VKKHEQMIDRARISMWLGKGISTGREMASYMLTTFAKDFGFSLPTTGGLEMTPTLDWSKQVPIRRIDALLKGFARSQIWLPAAVDVARKLGWLEARAAVIFDAFEYDRSLIVNPTGPLTYVGSFNR